MADDCKIAPPIQRPVIFVSRMATDSPVLSIPFIRTDGSLGFTRIINLTNQELTDLVNNNKIPVICLPDIPSSG